MDSVTQITLGSAVSLAVLGRRTAPWKAALWGALCGTLPDLDALIDHGDAVRNMTFHRAQSHSLFYLTLLSPLVAAAAVTLHRETQLWKRWWLAVWLVLVTHPLLDAMTVYGTQLLLPFTDRPFGVGSIFIIDPLYTVPLLAGVAAALRATPSGRRWNALGLALSTAYLGWSALAQQHVTELARASLARQGHQVERLLVTPTAFNTVLWRVVVVTPEGYLEGFRSLRDRSPDLRFDAFARGVEWRDRLRGHWPVERMEWFARGFIKLHEREGRVLLSDLRMGQEPYYTFTFPVAQRQGAGLARIERPPLMGQRPDVERALPWLWRRMWGEEVAPPR